MIRYDMTAFEWRVIEPLLFNIPEVCRASMTGACRTAACTCYGWVRRGATGLSAKDRSTTCYNHCVRWRQAGVWGRIMAAIATAHDGDKQMIDSTSIRAHHRVGTAKGGSRSLSRLFARRAHHQNPCSRRCARNPDPAKLIRLAKT